MQKVTNQQNNPGGGFNTRISSKWMGQAAMCSDSNFTPYADQKPIPTVGEMYPCSSYMIRSKHQSPPCDPGVPPSTVTETKYPSPQRLLLRVAKHT